MTDPRAAAFKADGWSLREDAPCPGLIPGTLYEVTAGEESAEFYYSLTGEALSKRSFWPEEPRTCREISEPTNIEELQ